MTKTVSPAFSWTGTKTRQLKYIIPLLEPIPRKRFVDVFGGAGTITMNLSPSRYNTFNDVDELITNFFKTLLDDEKREQFNELLDYSPACKEIGYYWRGKLSSESDVRRAAAFFYLANYSVYGAFGHGLKTYSTSNTSSGSPCQKFNFKRAKIAEVVEKFKQVEICNLDFRKAFETFDDEQTLFYCDPPYICRDKYYNSDFSLADCADLTRCCLNAKGKVVLSCYDDPVFSPLLEAGWNRRQWERPISYRKNQSKFNCVETLYISPEIDLKDYDEILPDANAKS